MQGYDARNASNRKSRRNARPLMFLLAGLTCVSLMSLAGCAGSTTMTGARNSATRTEVGPTETLEVDTGDPRTWAPYWSPDHDAHVSGGEPSPGVRIKPDGTVDVAPGQPARIRRTTTGGTLNAANTSDAGSVTSDDAQAAKDFDGSASPVDQPNSLGGGKGGPAARKPSASTISLEGIVPSQAGVLYVLGGLCVIGGVALAWWRKSPTIGVLGAGTGAALIASAVVAESAPWVFAVALVLGLGAAGWFVWDSIRAKRVIDRAKAGTIAIEAISAADRGDASAGQQVKDLIGEWYQRGDKTRDLLDREVERIETGRGASVPQV